MTEQAKTLEETIQSAVEMVAFRAVRLDESLLSTLIIDSIGLVDLVVILEKKLSIGLDLGAISRENFDTVNDMVLHVQELAGRK